MTCSSHLLIPNFHHTLSPDPDHTLNLDPVTHYALTLVILSLVSCHKMNPLLGFTLNPDHHTLITSPACTLSSYPQKMLNLGPLIDRALILITYQTLILTLIIH